MDTHDISAVYYAMLAIVLVRDCRPACDCRERKALRKKMGLDEDEETEVEDPGEWGGSGV